MIQRRKTGHYRNIGLLILRAGLGIMLVLHGFPKVFGGPETWVSVGSSIGFIGLGLDPMFFGFMAGIFELFGGIFFILGLFFRPALVLIICALAFTTTGPVTEVDLTPYISHSIELGIVFVSLFFIGAGKYSLDNVFNNRRRRY